MRKDSLEEQVLRASKEVVVKFIEVGRLSPSNFTETFTSVFQAIYATVRSTSESAAEDASPPPR